MYCCKSLKALPVSNSGCAAAKSLVTKPKAESVMVYLVHRGFGSVSLLSDHVECCVVEDSARTRNNPRKCYLVTGIDQQPENKNESWSLPK